MPVRSPHSSGRQWLPNSCVRSSLGRPARARALCARGSPRTLASSISPAATSCGRTSRPIRVRRMRGRGGGGEPKRDRVRPGLFGWPPGGPSPARVRAPTCRGACSRWPAAVRLNRARGEGRGSLGGRGGVRCSSLRPGSSCLGEKPVTTQLRVRQLAMPTAPLALPP